MIVAATSQKGLVLTLHQGFARAFLIYCGLLALWGLYLWLRGSNPSGGYLGALILCEGLGVVQGLVGLGLVLQGHQPSDALHYLYGVVAVATLPAAYFSPWSSGGTERKDSLGLGLACVFLVGIAIRGVATGSA